MFFYVSIFINFGFVVKYMYNKNNFNVVKGLKYVDFIVVFFLVWMWINLSIFLKFLIFRNIVDMYFLIIVVGYINVWLIGML